MREKKGKESEKVLESYIWLSGGRREREGGGGRGRRVAKVNVGGEGGGVGGRMR